jgi:hypothetical protein
MSKSRFIMMFLITVLVALCMSPGTGWATPPAKDTLYVTAQPTTGGKIPGTIGSDESAKYEYYYEWSCNSQLPDTLNVDFRITNTNSSSAEECYTINFSQSGNPGVVATFPTSFSLCDDGETVSKTIGINAVTPPLASGNYQKNININPPSNALIEIKPKDIQVSIKVNECEAPSEPTCFFTNSDFVFLSDCLGEFVSTEEGGTFMLVNKKNGVIVSTNPGQFYYNYLWTNDGPAVDVRVETGPLENLVPHGANALHAYTFDTSGFTQDLASYLMVNNDGTPCGPDGPCAINVGEGETLWVTWHLEYAHVGDIVDAGTTCPGSEEINAGAHLIDAVSKEPIVGAGDCITKAFGYNVREIK